MLPPAVRNFRKRPVVIEAIELSWSNWNAVCEFVPRPHFIKGTYINPDGSMSEHPVGIGGRLGLRIKTLEGEILATEGDWIIKGIKGEFYPCKPDIFATTYEPVEHLAACAMPTTYPQKVVTEEWNQAEDDKADRIVRALLRDLSLIFIGVICTLFVLSLCK